MQKKNEVLQAMHRELNLRKDYLVDKSVKTIYFGGGTPSLLSGEELFSFVDKCRKYFDVSNDAEITLEANPDDLTREKIIEFKKAGINRLSIGIQSFRNTDLEWMNRSHNAEQAIRSVKIAQEEGIDNISIDLIYGIPGLSDDEWKENVQTAIDLNVPHISAYCLTVEPGTALDHFVTKKKAKPVDEEQASSHFLIMMKMLDENGFIAYEISNFGKSGYFSKHNSAYWNGSHYLGIGPSAHSYNGNSRSYNIANNAIYIKNISEGKDFQETEILTPKNKFNEYVMTRLRTMWGISEDKIWNDFGEEVLLHTRKETRKWIASNKISVINNKYILTTEGRLLADKIIGDLFLP